jgi:hypothetical protein
MLVDRREDNPARRVGDRSAGLEQPDARPDRSVGLTNNRRGWETTKVADRHQRDDIAKLAPLPLSVDDVGIVDIGTNDILEP